MEGLSISEILRYVVFEQKVSAKYPCSKQIGSCFYYTWRITFIDGQAKFIRLLVDFAPMVDSLRKPR